jgi:hypothetical protein
MTKAPKSVFPVTGIVTITQSLTGWVLRSRKGVIAMSKTQPEDLVAWAIENARTNLTLLKQERIGSALFTTLRAVK